MTTYEDALIRAQDMIDAAYNNALTYEGASKYGMTRTNALSGLAHAQLMLADRLKAGPPEPDETPAEASLGLLLRMLEDGGLERALYDVIPLSSPERVKVAHVIANVVWGIVYAAPTEQKVTLVAEPEGQYFPSYRDATYKTADYPLKKPERMERPLCRAVSPANDTCQFWSGHTAPRAHSWEL